MVSYPTIPDSIRTTSTHRLSFSAADGQTPECTLVSTFVEAPVVGMNFMETSRAGYTLHKSLVTDNRVGVFRPEDGTAKYIELDVGVHRARYASLGNNGGLVVLHESGAEILYYD
jgi:hypothetical protein